LKRENSLAGKRTTINRLFRPQPVLYPDSLSLHIAYFNDKNISPFLQKPYLCVFYAFLKRSHYFLNSIDCEVEVFHSPDAENAGFLEDLNPDPQFTGFCKRDPMGFIVRFDQN